MVRTALYSALLRTLSCALHPLSGTPLHCSGLRALRAPVLLVLPALLLGSCHKELCMDHHHDGMQLRVEFDWGGTAPAGVHGMTLLLYPEEGGAPLRYNFSNPDGGLVSVTSGSYRALCVNDDELLRLENTGQWETVSVTTGETDILSRSAFGGTRSAIPRAQGTGDEPVLREPPLLYTATDEDVYVRALASGETQVLRLVPVMPLGIMHVRVEDVANLGYLQTVSGAVSGLSSSLSLTTLQPSGSHCTVPVTLRATADGALEGYVRYFGHCPADVLGHVLSVYTMLIDTSRQLTTYDVTGQLHAREDDPSPEVVVSGLPLPDPQPAEGGFSIGLDGWTVDGIDLRM